MKGSDATAAAYVYLAGTEKVTMVQAVTYFDCKDRQYCTVRQIGSTENMIANAERIFPTEIEAYTFLAAETKELCGNAEKILNDMVELYETHMRAIDLLKAARDSGLKIHDENAPDSADASDRLLEQPPAAPPKAAPVVRFWDPAAGNYVEQEPTPAEPEGEKEPARLVTDEEVKAFLDLIM